MKKLFLSVLLLSSVLAFAQNIKLEDAKKQSPLILVDGFVYSSDFNKIDPNTIESMNVYKDAKNLDENLSAFKNLADLGIIAIRLKKPLEYPTHFPVSKLNEMNGLSKDNPVYLDGILLTDNSAEIYENSVIEMKTVETDSGKVLNIKTLTKEQEQMFLQKPKESSVFEVRQKERPEYIKGIQ